MGDVRRREFLGWVGAAGVVTAVGGRALAQEGLVPPIPPGYTPTWPDGVIAGDPLPAGTIVWTRLEPPTGGLPLPVTWEVATDDTFTTIVAGGGAVADSSADHTVKVPVSGLDPDAWYAYRFLVGATPSPVAGSAPPPPPTAPRPPCGSGTPPASSRTPACTSPSGPRPRTASTSSCTSATTSTSATAAT